jgi:hypothetical protein
VLRPDRPVLAQVTPILPAIMRQTILISNPRQGFSQHWLGLSLCLLLGSSLSIAPWAIADESHDHGSDSTMPHHAPPASSGVEGHGTMDHSHQEMLELSADQPIPTIAIVVHPDPVSGWNLEIRTTNFRFAPETVNQDHVPNQGHGHLYINGEKVSRVYGPWLHLPTLPPGRNEITVELNANNHQVFAYDGNKIAATAIVDVP